MNDEKSKEILAKLKEIAQKPGFVRVLAGLVRSDMFFGVTEAADVDWRSRLSNQEITLLTGYMVKKPVLDAELETDDEAAIAAEVRKLLQELHDVQSLKMFDELMAKGLKQKSQEEAAAEVSEVLSAGSNMVEPIFYGDTGAYDSQFLETAPKLYKNDKEWLEANFIDLEVAGKYYQAAYTSVLAKATIGNIDPDQAIEPVHTMSFSAEELLGCAKKLYPSDATLSEESVKTFLKLFSVKAPANTSFTGPGDYNVTNSNPLIEVTDNYYFMPVNLNLAEAIYVNPFYGMITDKDYKDKVAKHRGDAVEDIAYDTLKGTFGDNVYKRVKIVKGKTTLTDADVMVVVGNKAVIFQCKAKKLTELSRHGDPESLMSDFQKAIQKSYNEAVIIRSTLLGGEEYKLIDDDGNEITLPNGIDDAYIVCVTADVYPAALYQVDQFLSREKDDPYCFPISLFDLETTAEYLKLPYEFLFYIKQRIDLVEVIKAESEMAYLGYHLKQRLSIPKDADRMLVSQDFGQLIDADYLYRRGRAAEPPEQHKLISEKDNPTRARLIKEVSSHPSPEMTDAIMFLYGIADDSLDELGEYMEKAKAKAKRNGKASDLSTRIGGTWGGLTYVCAPTYPDLHRAMLKLAEINKHRFKSEQWLALGTVPGEERLVSYMLYSNQPWKPSAEMDAKVKLHEQGGKRIKAKQEKAQRTKEHKKKEKTKKKIARQGKRKNRK